jgi:hypothetical protein
MTNPTTETEYRDIPAEILSKAKSIYEGSWPDPVAAIAEALMEASSKREAEVTRLQRLLRNRDRMAEASRKFWVRAAKAAMAGDFRELRNRVDLAEAEPMQIFHSSALQEILHEKQEVQSW